MTLTMTFEPMCSKCHFFFILKASNIFAVRKTGLHISQFYVQRYSSRAILVTKTKTKMIAIRLLKLKQTRTKIFKKTKTI